MAKKGSDIDGVGGHFDNPPESMDDDGIYSRAPEEAYTIPAELFNPKGESLDVLSYVFTPP